MEHHVVAGSNGDSTKQVLWMAMELSLSKWKLGFSDGSTRAARVVTIEARDYAALEQQIERARRTFKLSDPCLVRSMYEAGREGFSVHPRLEQLGIENVIVDPASLEVSRHARRAKSDKLDVESLLRHLMAYGANRGRLAIVRVPKPEDESRRHLDREIEALQKERGVHTKRIQALLFAQGIATEVKPKLFDNLGSLRTADGRALPEELMARIRREQSRLELVQEHLRALQKERQTQIAQGTGATAERMRVLMSLCGIGCTGSFRLVVEFFGWRTFRESPASGASRRAGLGPYASGKMDHDQGISKAGNRRVRALMIELAWSGSDGSLTASSPSGTRNDSGTRRARMRSSANKSAIQVASFTSVLRPGTFLMCAAEHPDRHNALCIKSMAALLWLRRCGIPEGANLARVLRGRTRPAATIRGARGIPGPTKKRACNTIENPTSVPTRDPACHNARRPFPASRVRRLPGGGL
jgi:transposase